jgi:hypothetical protein
MRVKMSMPPLTIWYCEELSFLELAILYILRIHIKLCKQTEIKSDLISNALQQELEYIK